MFFPQTPSPPHTQATLNITLHKDLLSRRCYCSKSVISSLLFFPALFFFPWKSICTVLNIKKKKNTITVTHLHCRMQVNKVLRCSIHRAVNHFVTQAHCLGCVHFDKANITAVPPSDSIWEPVWAKGLTMKCQPPKGQLWVWRAGAYVKPLLSIADALSLKGQSRLIRKVMALLWDIKQIHHNTVS